MLRDPDGPLALRALRHVPALGLLALSVLVSESSEAGFWLSRVLGIGACLGFFGGAILDVRRRTASDVSLECGAGYLKISQAGLWNQRVVARDILGASTARTRDKVAVTLCLRDRVAPMTLELASVEDVEAIRKALGIGHGGYGILGWQRSSRALHVAVIPSFITLALALTFVSSSAFYFFASVLALLAMPLRRREIDLFMSADGIHIRVQKRWTAFRYHDLDRIEDAGAAIRFHVVNGPPFDWPIPHESFGGLAPEERRVLVEQLSAAIARARGFGAPKDDPSLRVNLARGPAEAPQAWTTRLNVMAQRLSAGNVYRGDATNIDDLWAVLEDPDSTEDLRAAAAHVLALANVPHARVRIASALATLRDDAARQRLRVVTDEAFQASSAYVAATEDEDAPPPDAAAQRMR